MPTSENAARARLQPKIKDLRCDRAPRPTSPPPPYEIRTKFRLFSCIHSSKHYPNPPRLTERRRMSESDPVSVAVQQIREVQPGVRLDSLVEKLDADQLAVYEEVIAGSTYKDASEATGV